MRAAGVQRLHVFGPTGPPAYAAAETIKAVASVFPDSKSQLASMANAAGLTMETNVAKLMEWLQYKDEPELLSMHLCLCSSSELVAYDLAKIEPGRLQLLRQAAGKLRRSLNIYYYAMPSCLRVAATC